MIARVRGVVVEKFANSIIVDVAGIGYEVQAPFLDYETVSLNDEVTFHTYHHIREQSQDLFGFSSLLAKKLFELLITVQGVGPKAALAILSIGPYEQVRNAIAGSDSAYLAKASGVGKKTAERVAVDLSDKVGLPTSYATTPYQSQNQLSAGDEALEALMALGYTLADATAALEEIDRTLPTSERVTLALKA
jgi:Holliday junction DNA helicase RuvA